ncbi:hypothetical protein ACFUEN_29105 [Streptomyces griseorubiginosus]|uniref:hypothetical protein n=1 Tax=Streptomyces griseorubiginosus TaxID=67304 RepID=UPI003634BA65
MTVPINEPALPDVFVPTGFSAVLEEPGLATPDIHPYRVDLVGRSLDQPDRVQPRRLVLHPELASQIVGRLAGLIAREERQNTDWANLLSDDPAELTQQAGHLRDVLTVLASHAPAPLPTAQELAEGATADKATAQRIHTARPGIPAHTAFNVLQALRAVRTVDHAPSPDRENRIPLDQLTAEELELLYDDLDRYAEVLSEMNDTVTRLTRRAEELAGARANIDQMIKAIDWFAGPDRQGLSRARAAAVRQARQWAARARTAEAAVHHWTAFIERGMDTHMQFSVLHPDGTTEQLPCADWCYACRIENAETALATAQADTLRKVANELEGIDFHPNAKATSRDLCRLLADRFRRKALERLEATRATAQPTSIRARTAEETTHAQPDDVPAAATGQEASDA